MSKPNLVLNHAKEIIQKGYRFDKRAMDEYRDIQVETGVSKTAEGSARVRFGETEVMVGIKLGIEKPYPDCPNRGNVSVNVELLALSSPEFEPGPPSNQAVELARVVDRGVREGGAIDMEAMCITPGEAVWTAFIDVCTINDAGNLFDAASLGALAALKDTKLPVRKEDGTLDYKEKTDKGLPLHDEPVEVTVLKIGDKFIVDPIREEEKVLDSRLTVAFTKDDKICALQKGGEVPMTADDVAHAVDIATSKVDELRKHV